MNPNRTIALVTGSTAGIGFVTARRLAEAGAAVYLVGRTPERLAAAKASIEASVSGATVGTFAADLSLMSEVRRLAEQVKAEVPGLNLLVNNAGGLFQSRVVTAEGFELTFAFNHLSYFLLTNLLLPVLKAQPSARIVSVASDAHRAARLDFDDLQSERSFFHFRVYGTSKLMNILFTKALARRLVGTNVTANCLHPGFVDSEFGDNNKTFFGKVVWLTKRFAISVERGAETSVYLATSPEVAGVSGEYFHKCRVKKPTSAARDDAAGERLWEESTRLTQP
ncbi:MAG: SDR family oxidoreductase [Myxococcales bacterium]|nr:SDR family oxidoreductase [Myxococcales bacterium]